MKKYILALLLSTGVYADFIESVQIGVEGWQESSSGSYSDSTGSIELDNLKLESNLNPSIYLNIKLPDSLNFKFQYTSIANNSSTTNEYKSTFYDGIIYSDLVEDKLLFGKKFNFDLDVGLGFRHFDSKLLNSIGFRQTIALLYARAEFTHLYTNLTPLTQIIYSPIYGTNIDAKVGLLYTLFDSYSAEIGYRYNKTRVNDTYSANIITDGPYFGFAYKFGAGKNEPKEEEPVKEITPLVIVPLDEDKDSVIDESDKCPNTKQNSIVNSEGCASYQLDDDKDGVFNNRDLCLHTLENTAVNEHGCKLDADRDTVTDSIDICPNTDENLTVNEQGCAKNQLDSDKDGVFDDIDLCVHTAIGTKIDETGCEKIVISIAGFEDIKFKHASTKLTKESKNTLERLAKDLKEHPNYNVNVEGHTSNSYRSWKYKKVPKNIKGEESTKRYLNTKISQKRADVVKAYLMSIGANPAVITAVGHGPDKPKASNDTEEGRAKNRRVEIIIDTLER